MNKTDLRTKTKEELLVLAQRLGLRGISTMNKPALVDTISQAQARRAVPLKKKADAAVQKAADEIKRRAVRKHPGKTLKSAAKVIAPTPVAPKRTAKAKRLLVPETGAEIAAHKFDVAPAKQSAKQVFLEENLGELPDSYETGRLFLVARDPHWLFAYWDLTFAQMADYRHRSSDNRLVLRLFEKGHDSVVQELTLQHDSRNWYIPVNKAATSYSADFGFWRHDGSFHVINRSREATTPPDHVSADRTAQFVTIPIDVQFSELVELIRSNLREGERIAEALVRLQAAGFKFPFAVGVNLGPWSPEQTAQMEQVIGGDVLKRTRVDSLEMTEWLRRRLSEETSSGMFSAFSPAGASWSGQPQQGFWFAVNAELIIYGATEPDAKVTVDGKPIKLRSDGTFSFHYAFPDGQYRMPVVAVSAKGHDQRAVELQFERKTKTIGEVGKVKQSAHLKAPLAE